MQNVIGSYVVYDPTGRDLRDCMEVGRVVAAYFDSEADDGNPDGTPRVILRVQPNGDNRATMAVTHVSHYFDSEMSALALATRLRLVGALEHVGRELSELRETADDMGALDVLHPLDLAGDEIDRSIGILLP